LYCPKPSKSAVIPHVSVLLYMRYDSRIFPYVNLTFITIISKQGLTLVPGSAGNPPFHTGWENQRCECVHLAKTVQIWGEWRVKASTLHRTCVLQDFSCGLLLCFHTLQLISYIFSNFQLEPSQGELARRKSLKKGIAQSFCSGVSHKPGISARN
jgi:hypothetical protein